MWFVWASSMTKLFQDGSYTTALSQILGNQKDKDFKSNNNNRLRFKKLY